MGGDRLSARLKEVFDKLSDDSGRQGLAQSSATDCGSSQAIEGTGTLFGWTKLYILKTFLELEIQRSCSLNKQKTIVLYVLQFVLFLSCFC